jgi:hypothetical protein
MDDLKLRLVFVAIVMMLSAMISGIFGPDLARTAMGEELQWWQLVLGGGVFIGLCGMIIPSRDATVGKVFQRNNE